MTKEINCFTKVYNLFIDARVNILLFPQVMSVHMHLTALTGCASAPRNVRMTEIWRDFITIAWDAPESDGGSPLTGYAVECRDSFESSYRLLATVKPDTTSYTAKDLQEGRDYYLRVFSQNAAGLSEQPVELLPAIKARLPFGKYIVGNLFPF